MEKLTIVQGVAAALPEPNINTDDIIPAVWVLNPATNLGEKLFANRRYVADGGERPDFILNQSPFRQSVILLSGENFGCGSSREAAVWALLRFGIRVVIAPSFGDIFFENCFQNGVLPIRMAAEHVRTLLRAQQQSESKQFTVDLLSKTIIGPAGNTLEFDVSDQRREALLLGRDTFNQLLSWQADTACYEAADRRRRPWLWHGDKQPV